MGLIKSVVFSLTLASIGVVVGLWLAGVGNSSETSTRILVIFFGALFGFSGFRIGFEGYEL